MFANIGEGGLCFVLFLARNILQNEWFVFNVIISGLSYAGCDRTSVKRSNSADVGRGSKGAAGLQGENPRHLGDITEGGVGKRTHVWRGNYLFFTF